MPARFLNDHDINTIRKAGISMDSIPLITGDRFEGLMLDATSDKPVTNFHSVQVILMNILTNFYQGILVFIRTQSFDSITNEQVLAISIVFGIIALLQVYLSIP